MSSVCCNNRVVDGVLRNNCVANDTITSYQISLYLVTNEVMAFYDRIHFYKLCDIMYYNHKDYNVYSKWYTK